MKRVLVALLVVLALSIMIGCSDAGNDGDDVNPLVGTWVGGITDLAEETYKLNSDKSFSYKLTGLISINYSGTYAYTDTEITLSYTISGSPQEQETSYDYSVSGNTLTLTDPSDDTSTEYTKQ